MEVNTFDVKSVPSRLTFLGDTPTPTTRPRWGVYACECGWIGKKVISEVNYGTTRSCGCLKREFITRASTKHGHAKRGASTATHRSWMAMRERVLNPNQNHWHRYGGRGITFVDRWNIYENFLADMGEKPANKTLDRIDNDKGYSKENCRWASKAEQIYNKSNTLRVEWNGQSLTIPELAAVVAVPESNIRDRLKKGWTVERAATIPVARRKNEVH